MAQFFFLSPTYNVADEKQKNQWYISMDWLGQNNLRRRRVLEYFIHTVWALEQGGGQNTAGGERKDDGAICQAFLRLWEGGGRALPYLHSMFFPQ